jgi:hypothetical protein
VTLLTGGLASLFVVYLGLPKDTKPHNPLWTVNTITPADHRLSHCLAPNFSSLPYLHLSLVDTAHVKDYARHKRGTPFVFQCFW